MAVTGVSTTGVTHLFIETTKLVMLCIYSSQHVEF